MYIAYFLIYGMVKNIYDIYLGKNSLAMLYQSSYS
jgi:hypothetical protein